jgi:hypothetical protein
MCVVGFRSPARVVLYRLDSRGPPNPVATLSLDDREGQSPELTSGAEIQSIEYLQTGGLNYVLVGLRNGRMASAEIAGDLDNSPHFTRKQTTRLGTSQVEFISATFRFQQLGTESSGVFVFCEYLWEVTVQNGRLRIDEVLFDAYRTVLLLLPDSF